MNKAIFLDRDGTINVDKSYLYKIEEFEFAEGALEGLKMLQAAGFLLIIITNQSGIARGYYDVDDFLRLNRWMLNTMEAAGIHITGTYYCPHLVNGSRKQYAVDCNCRKPRTGLFYKAAKEHNITFEKSFVIGDKNRDLAICGETKAKGILLLQDNQMKEDTNAEITARDLLCAAQYIIKREYE